MSPSSQGLAFLTAGRLRTHTMEGSPHPRGGGFAHGEGPDYVSELLGGFVKERAWLKSREIEQRGQKALQPRISLIISPSSHPDEKVSGRPLVSPGGTWPKQHTPQ